MLAPGLLPCPFGRFGLRRESAIYFPSGRFRFGRFHRSNPAPEIVIGEVHHPVEAREIFNPGWLTIPERGLYTAIAIFGAVGSGKTSACMHPFAKQLLSWQADDPERRAAASYARSEGGFLP